MPNSYSQLAIENEDNNQDFDCLKNKILAPYTNILKSTKDVYIFGAKQLGIRLSKAFDAAGYIVKGYIDNNKEAQKQLIEGVHVYSPEELEDKNSVIIICSLNYAYEINNQLIKQGFKNIIPCHILSLYNQNNFKAEPALDGLLEDVTQNIKEYENFKNLLQDKKSKFVLDKIIEFRQTYNINIFSKICDDINNQYFEDFMPNDDSVFIDGGAFDGDTVIKALEHKRNYKKIYFFEPDETSFKQAQVNLKSMNNVVYFQKGLSDTEKTLKFSARGDFGSLFCKEGDIELLCVNLDDTVKEDKAFIKLDIEGSEIEAINGAKRLIKNNSSLAICVYHKPEDIWKIPKLILKINPNYKFKLRHYTNSIFDTILYGVVNDEN